MDYILSSICILTYLASLYLLYHAGSARGVCNPKFIYSAFIALTLHALATYHVTFSSNQINLGLSNSLVVTSFTIAALSLAIHLKENFRLLVGISWMWSVATLTAHMLIPIPANIVLTSAVAIHVFLSIAAYTAISVAAVVAFITLLLDHLLKRRKGMVLFSHFPPLQSMESIFFTLLFFGEILLTAALLSGMFSVDSFLGQHLLHKSILSFIAWFIFLVILLTRYFTKLRGPGLLKWSLGAFVLTFVGFFGSKFVLEILLG